AAARFVLGVEADDRKVVVAQSRRQSCGEHGYACQHPADGLVQELPRSLLYPRTPDCNQWWARGQPMRRKTIWRHCRTAAERIVRCTYRLRNPFRMLSTRATDE